MKQLLLFVGLLGWLQQPILGQTVPGILWKKVYGGKGEQRPVDIEPTFDGRIAVLGSTEQSATGKDVFWMIADKEGKLQHAKIIGGFGDDVPRGFCQTFDGGFVVVGNSASNPNRRDMPWILKLSEDGDTLWQKHIDGSGKSAFFDIIQTWEGYLVITGFTKSKSGAHSDIWVYSTYEDGTLRWEKTYGDSGEDEGKRIVEALDGTIGVAGTTTSGKGSQNLWLLNIDKEGTPLQYHIYGARQWEEFSDLVATSDGGFALAGIAKTTRDNKGKGLKDCWLIKTSSNGDLQWQNTYGGSNNDGAFGLAETIDGGFVMVGYTFSHLIGANNSAGFIVKSDKNGNQVWADNKIFATKSNDELNFATTMQDGSIVVLGSTAAKSEDADGRDLWVTHLVPESYIDHRKRTQIFIKNVELLDNGDQNLEEGEKAYLKIIIENGGKNDAYDVELNLNETTGAKGLKFREFQKIGVLRAATSKTIFMPIEGLTGIQLGDATLEIAPTDISRTVSKPFQKSINTQPLRVGSNFLDINWLDPNPVEFSNFEKTTKGTEVSIRLKARSDRQLMRKYFTVMVNGKPYRVGAKTGEVDLASLGKAKEIFQYEYTNRLVLQPGENIVEVVVDNESKRMTSKPFKIVLSNKPNLHILAIGIEHDDLYFTKQDARAFAESFRHQGNGIFDKIFITSMISGERTSAGVFQTNGDVLKNEFAQLRDKYNYTIYEQDLLVVFISSHGKNLKGEFKIVPSDYQLSGEPSLVDFKKHIVEPLEVLPCTKLLIVDACHSGSGETVGAAASGGESSKLLVSTGAENKSTSMLASCGANESSWEDKKWGHGAFTAAILAAFRNELCSDANGTYQASADDNVLTVGELYSFISRRVPQMIKEAGKQGTQKPHMDAKQLINIQQRAIFEVKSLN